MSGGYDAIIAAASRKYGVPESYIRSVMQVESSGNPAARSPKGAAGLMQIMPDTYTDLARRHSLGPDRFDPTNNIHAGTAYLGEMHQQFGNWDEALMAYNMGPGRMTKVRAGAATVPGETRDYLPKVRAALGLPPTPQSVDEGANMPSFSFAAPQQQRVGSLTGLLQVDDDKNFYEGLGGIWNTGQTPSQPPRTDPAAVPGTTQTDRLNLGGRMNDVVQQLLQQQSGPKLSPLQYQLAGAGRAVGDLAGITNRRVGIGELLGALGGGLTSGTASAQQAQRDDLQGQLTNLTSAAKIQDYQRDEAARAQRAQAVAAMVRQLRDAGRHEEAQLLETNPALIDKLAEQRFKTPEPFTVGQGEVRYDGNGRVIARGDPKPQDTFATLSPQEVAAQGLPPGTVAQRGSDGKITVLSKPPDNPDQSFDKATKLRTEFGTQAKPLADMRQHYGRMEAAYNDNSGQADIALVYSFMKMLDPTSVVRETEFATAENATGVPDRIRQLWNKTLNGERLPPQARADMLKQGQAQYGSVEKQHSELENRYRDLARRNGLNPDDVVIDFRGGVKMPPAAENGANAGGGAGGTGAPPPAGLPALPPGFRVVR